MPGKEEELKISELRCERFAGLRDRDYRFEDGLNLLIGANESGKSTLVDLIYSLFFQDARLDGRSDREFREKYFPRTTGTYQGDTIDGSLRFETPEGTYKLSKEWSSSDASCRLTLPDGTLIRDQAGVNSVLAGILDYGKGVYDELVFASGKRDRSVLTALLGTARAKDSGEIASALRRTVLETGGCDPDGMERELLATLSAYDGRWDFDSDMPQGGVKRGLGNKWVQGSGLILKAYYEKEEAKEELRRAQDTENRIDRLSAGLASGKEDLSLLRSRRERFTEVMGLIARQRTAEKLLEATEEDLRRMDAVRDDWPEKELVLRRVKDLSSALAKAGTLRRFSQAAGMVDELRELEEAIEDLGGPEEEDVIAAEGLERELGILRSSLGGMNVKASVTGLGDADIYVTSVVTGETRVSSDGTYGITEATKITIPGVAEIILSPGDTDMLKTGEEIASKEGSLTILLEKYGAGSAAELRRKYSDARQKTAQHELLSEKLANVLEATPWEELSEEAAGLAGEDLPGEDEIMRELTRLCGGKSPEMFIGSVGAVLDGYVSSYRSMDELLIRIGEKQEERDRQRTALESASDIPAEFSAVEDPDKYAGELKAKEEKAQKDLDSTRIELSSAIASLGDLSAEELLERSQRAQKAFEDTREEYFRWKHIYDVFIRVRTELEKDPMKDIQENFAKYLSAVSGGRTGLGSMGKDLSSTISSGDSVLTDKILSEGTKDTIVLAFRLAVLEHLFPDGGCVAVFDDPFTDMDPERTGEACRLLEKFAENNQVIFVSCDGKYTDMMEGNVIMAEGRP